MKWVVIGFALFLFILLWLNVKVVIEARTGVENSGLHIEVILLKSLLRREFTLKDLKAGIGEDEAVIGWRQKEEAGQGKTLDKKRPRMTVSEIRQRINEALSLRREVSRRRWLMRLMRASITVKVFQWRTVVGFDDAMYTGLATGALWSFKGWVLVLVSSMSRLKEHRIEVVPSFDARRLESVGHFEVLFRLAYLIIIAPAALILLRRAGRVRPG